MCKKIQYLLPGCSPKHQMGSSGINIQNIKKGTFQYMKFVIKENKEEFWKYFFCGIQTLDLWISNPTPESVSHRALWCYVSLRDRSKLPYRKVLPRQHMSTKH